MATKSFLVSTFVVTSARLRYGRLNVYSRGPLLRESVGGVINPFDAVVNQQENVKVSTFYRPCCLSSLRVERTYL